MSPSLLQLSPPHLLRDTSFCLIGASVLNQVLPPSRAFGDGCALLSPAREFAPVPCFLEANFWIGWFGCALSLALGDGWRPLSPVCKSAPWPILFPVLLSCVVSRHRLVPLLRRRRARVVRGRFRHRRRHRRRIGRRLLHARGLDCGAMQAAAASLVSPCPLLCVLNCVCLHRVHARFLLCGIPRRFGLRHARGQLASVSRLRCA